MPPEQLVDVPVPQIPQRPSRRELHEVLCRLAAFEEEEEEEEAGAEDEEEEEVEGSRFLPHFRPRRWCWYVHAGSICPRGWQCTFAHHESELHPDSWLCDVVVGCWCLGPGAWHPLDPSWVPLPVPGAGKIFWGNRVRGLASLDLLLGAFPWCASTTDHGSCGGVSACAYCRGTDRGMPVPQIMPVRGGGQHVRCTSTGAVLGQGC